MCRVLFAVLLGSSIVATGCKSHSEHTATAAPAARASAPQYKYLDVRTFDLATALPPPPADQTALTRGEIELMLAVQTDATEIARARAKAEESLRVWMFADVLGPGFSKEKMPKTAELLKRVEEDATLVTANIKSTWPRTRPNVVDNRVTPLLTVPKNASYPSGHAVYSMAWARVLAKLAPDKEQELLRMARLIGYDRVVAGLHFPIDIAAGLGLGDLIAQKCAESAAFQADLAAARVEWASPMTPN